MLVVRLTAGDERVDMACEGGRGSATQVAEATASKQSREWCRNALVYDNLVFARLDAVRIASSRRPQAITSTSSSQPTTHFRVRSDCSGHSGASTLAASPTENGSNEYVVEGTKSGELESVEGDFLCGAESGSSVRWSRCIAEPRIRPAARLVWLARRQAGCDHQRSERTFFPRFSLCCLGSVLSFFNPTFWQDPLVRMLS